jgi:hypothetical protein
MTPTRPSPEERLRAALEFEAQRVEISPDALGEIRTRIRRRSWWTAWRAALGGGAVAAVAGGAAVAVLVAGPAGPPPDTAPLPPVVPSPARPAPPTTEPTAAPTTGPPTLPPVTPGFPVWVGTPAVYFVGPDRLVTEAGERIERPRLYREFPFLRLGDTSLAGRTRAALDAMFVRTPADPDYTSAWPSDARVRSVRVDESTVIVDLTGAGDAVARTLPAESARIAVQQLVWTATAASRARSVRLLFDGRPAGLLFGHVPGDGDLRRAPQLEVAAPVWLIEPQAGRALAQRFTAHVAGSVFEATAVLRVRQGDRIVAERTITLDAGPPQRGEAKVTLTLPPGTYVVEAYATSAVDGSVQHLDDHTITVR